MADKSPYNKESPLLNPGSASNNMGAANDYSVFQSSALNLLANLNTDALKILLFDTFSNIDRLTDAFKELNPGSDDRKSGTDDALINLVKLEDWYRKMTHEVTHMAFVNAITTLLEHAIHDIQKINSTNTIGLIVILYNPIFLNPDHLIPLMGQFCQVLVKLEKKTRFALALTLQESIIISSKIKEERSHLFQQAVTLLQQFLTLSIVNCDITSGIHPFRDNPYSPTVNAVHALSLLSAVNDTNQFIPFYEFYNQSVEEMLDLKEDYPRWKSRDGFSICDYPFLLSTSIKGDILRIENMISMRHELQDAFFRALFIGVNSPYLNLDIRRDYILRDTLYQLSGKTKHDLKKQLKVSFVGEEGIDEGGVQREFFSILTSQLFDKAHGMFETNEESRLIWFARGGAYIDEDVLEEYKLIGKLIALAIYNGVIIEVSWPLALFKKLLGCRITLSDLAELDPSLASGLQKILEFEGDVGEVFQRNFSVDITTVLGETISKELVPGGDSIPVTNENVTEFVDLYVDYMLNESVDDAFTAFQDGFDAVMQDSSISIFRPEELMDLLQGSRTLDFKELEKVTKYDGFEADSPTIVNFWKIVHEFTEEQKRLLLSFTTGSDRVPVGGLSKLSFIIARNGSDSNRLPTSHTCFNVLMLSDYSSIDQLRDRLLTALKNANCGFFLN